MKFLVASALTQGEMPSHYYWCAERELVLMHEPCSIDRRDPDMPCGCGRGFSGMSSYAATTAVRVAEVRLSRDEMISALEATLSHDG